MWYSAVTSTSPSPPPPESVNVSSHTSSAAGLSQSTARSEARSVPSQQKLWALSSKLVGLGA